MIKLYFAMQLLHDMQAWLQQENKQVWAPKGLEVIDPLTNGLIFVRLNTFASYLFIYFFFFFRAYSNLTLTSNSWKSKCIL